MSFKDAIEKYGDNREIIVFMHYPPFGKEEISLEYDLKEVLKDYNVKKCFYGHLHGASCDDAIQGEIDNVKYILISSDYLDFKLYKVY